MGFRQRRGYNPADGDGVVHDPEAPVHELSIAQNIIELIDAAVTDPEMRRAGVCAVHLRIGTMAAVVPEALEFSFQIAANGSIAQGARLQIETVPLVVFCPVCNAERELPDVSHLVCPACHARTPEIRRGREMEIVSVEVNDAAPNH